MGISHGNSQSNEFYKKNEHILVPLENMEKVTLLAMEIGTSYYK